jgi:hypothetical protein
VKDIIRPTLSSVSEALWQESRDYGVEMAVDEQVIIARRVALLAQTEPKGLKPKHITDQFLRLQMRKPPPGYARAVIARLERLIL